MKRMRLHMIIMPGRSGRSGRRPVSHVLPGKGVGVSPPHELPSGPGRYEVQYTPRLESRMLADRSCHESLTYHATHIHAGWLHYFYLGQECSLLLPGSHWAVLLKRLRIIFLAPRGVVFSCLPHRTMKSPPRPCPRQTTVTRCPLKVLLVDGRVLPRRTLMAAVYKTAPQKSNKKPQTQASGQTPAASTASRS